MEFGFGQHVFDFDRRELRRGGTLIAREPQVFGVLADLVQNLDRVVSQDDHSEAVQRGRLDRGELACQGWLIRGPACSRRLRAE